MRAEDKEAAKAIIASRKRKTNCFSFHNEIVSWLDDGKADAFIIDDNVFLFLRVQSFYKFYYFVSELAQIAGAEKLLDEYRRHHEVTLEFTTKKNRNLDSVKDTVFPLGFSHYAEYARIISGPSAYESGVEQQGEYELASLDDTGQLLEIMYREFDVLTDYLPTEEELNKLINDKAVIVSHVDGRIIFIQIYEYTQGALYSRMTWIEKKYRKPKYTIDLYRGLDEYLKQLCISENKNLRSYGWINTANRNYKINLKFGAIPDGLTCNIFLYKPDKETPQTES